jgi:hypothetical protein
MPYRCSRTHALLPQSLGVKLHMLPLVYLGYGVIGGVGLGFGMTHTQDALNTQDPHPPHALDSLHTRDLRQPDSQEHNG